MMVVRRAIGGLCIGLFPAGVALAHHSFASFDQTKTVMLHGTVKDFQYTNPHSWIDLEVPLASPVGGGKVWALEGPPPTMLHRLGFTSHSLHPGDVVTVAIAPLRDGSNGGSFRSVTLASGQVLGRPPGAGPGSAGPVDGPASPPAVSPPSQP